MSPMVLLWVCFFYDRKATCGDNMAGRLFVERALRVWLKAVTPGHIRTYLAAMNAPRIIVNTVSWTGLENFFLWKVRQQRNSICLLRVWQEKDFIACPILLEKKSLSQHGKQDREPSEHSEHRQAVERAQRYYLGQILDVIESTAFNVNKSAHKALTLAFWFQTDQWSDFPHREEVEGTSVKPDNQVNENSLKKQI